MFVFACEVVYMLIGHVCPLPTKTGATIGQQWTTSLPSHDYTLFLYYLCCVETLVRNIITWVNCLHNVISSTFSPAALAKPCGPILRPFSKYALTSVDIQLYFVSFMVLCNIFHLKLVENKQVLIQLKTML